MIGLLFTLICLLLLGLSGWLFYHGVRKTERERVLNRLAEGQPDLTPQRTSWG
ncbi:type II secretion system protein F, partial [Pseudomonas protegens]